MLLSSLQCSICFKVVMRGTNHCRTCWAEGGRRPCSWKPIIHCKNISGRDWWTGLFEWWVPKVLVRMTFEPLPDTCDTWHWKYLKNSAGNSLPPLAWGIHIKPNFWSSKEWLCLLPSACGHEVVREAARNSVGMWVCVRWGMTNVFLQSSVSQNDNTSRLEAGPENCIGLWGRRLARYIRTLLLRQRILTLQLGIYKNSKVYTMLRNLGERHLPVTRAGQSGALSSSCYNRRKEFKVWQWHKGKPPCFLQTAPGQGFNRFCTLWEGLAITKGRLSSETGGNKSDIPTASLMYMLPKPNTIMWLEWCAPSVAELIITRPLLNCVCWQGKPTV